MGRRRVTKRPDPLYGGTDRPWKVQNCTKYNMELQYPSWSEAMAIANMPEGLLTKMIEDDFVSEGEW